MNRLKLEIENDEGWEISEYVNLPIALDAETAEHWFNWIVLPVVRRLAFLDWALSMMEQYDASYSRFMSQVILNLANTKINFTPEFENAQVH